MKSYPWLDEAAEVVRLMLAMPLENDIGTPFEKW